MSQSCLQCYANLGACSLVVASIINLAGVIQGVLSLIIGVWCQLILIWVTFLWGNIETVSDKCI